MSSHFFIMTLFSTLVGAFFGTLTRDSVREGVKAGALLAVTMVGVSLIIAYIMYVLPLGG
jgi:hypothetical protein